MIDIDISKIVSEIGEPKARFIESEEEKKQKRMILMFSLIFLGIFILGIFLFLGLSLRANGMSRVLTSDVEKLKEENNQLLSVEKQALSVKKRNQNAIVLLKNNADWSYVWDEMAKTTPPDIILTKLEVETLSSIRVSGRSPDYQTLSLFLVALEKSEMFARANLVNASLTVKDTGALVEFVLSVSLEKSIARESLNPMGKKQETPADNSSETTSNPNSNEVVTPENNSEGSETDQGTTKEEKKTNTNKEGDILPVL